jgi:hypothetical protein
MAIDAERQRLGMRRTSGTAEGASLMVRCGRPFAAAVSAVLCTVTLMVGLVGSAEAAAAPSMQVAAPQAEPRDPDHIEDGFGWSYECDAYRRDTINRLHPSFVSACLYDPGRGWYYVWRY